MFKEVAHVVQENFKLNVKGVSRMFDVVLFCTDLIAATRAEGGLVSFQAKGLSSLCR